MNPKVKEALIVGGVALIPALLTFLLAVSIAAMLTGEWRPLPRWK